MARERSAESKERQNWGVIDLAHPENYHPWIHTRELSSGRGKRHMFPDIYYPDRMIHLMSNLERDVYFHLRRNPCVIELFEQVCLEREETERICERLNIVHPKKPFTSQNIMMTTDFVGFINVNGEARLQAVAVKTDEELNDLRVLEKLKVEQQYWKARNIDWSIITETFFER